MQAEKTLLRSSDLMDASLSIAAKAKDRTSVSASQCVIETAHGVTRPAGRHRSDPRENRPSYYGQVPVLTLLFYSPNPSKRTPLLPPTAFGFDVRILNQTASLAAINVTGPSAARLLARAGAR